MKLEKRMWFGLVAGGFDVASRDPGARSAVGRLEEHSFSLSIANVKPDKGEMELDFNSWWTRDETIVPRSGQAFPNLRD